MKKQRRSVEATEEGRSIWYRIRSSSTILMMNDLNILPMVESNFLALLVLGIFNILLDFVQRLFMKQKIFWCRVSCYITPCWKKSFEQIHYFIQIQLSCDSKIAIIGDRKATHATPRTY